MQKAILDPEIVQGLVDLEGDGSPGLVAELLGLLLKSAPDGFANMENALARGDAAGVSGAAHSLKSSFANLGATELSRLCMEIETGARKGDLSSVPGHLGTLRAGFPGVERALRELADSLAK
jgi:HPt (histidine-containing phosphotransfer) domain-containing protein